MKYIMNGNDIAGADYGRIIYNENKILVKGFETNGYDYVDLGLPSGTLWATCNVGASSPEETGLFFQWGDTQGYTVEQVGTSEGKKSFNWTDYKYSEGGVNNNTPNLTKYCNDARYGKDGFTDNKITIDLEDDAVRHNMGGEWQMPSYNDFNELFNYTDFKIELSDGTTIPGVYSLPGYGIGSFNWGEEELGNRQIKGVKFINKTDDAKYILIPFSGYASDGIIKDYDSNCIISYNTVRGDYCYISRHVDIQKTNFYSDNSQLSRCSGLPVRGVIKK